MIEEVYDLEKDPDELNNLAVSPEYRNKLTELRGKAVEEFRKKNGGFVDHLPEPGESNAAQGKAVTIGLIGDSTVATTYGWGPAFAEMCDDRTTVLNYAKNGATLDSLSKKLDELLARKPDYVLIQFGHNDMKRYDSAAYAKKLASYAERIRKAGGKPVIFSSVTRRNFGKNGTITPRCLSG